MVAALDLEAALGAVAGVWPVIEIAANDTIRALMIHALFTTVFTSDEDTTADKSEQRAYHI